jgi:hypothetical protein
MKQIFALLISFFAATSVFAQDTTTAPQNIKVGITDKASDHMLIQFGADGWSGKPDSIRTKGFSRHFNIYFMFGKPFQNNPKLSVAYGAGIGSSNIFFDKMNIDLKSTAATLPFRRADSLDHFSKYKLTTIYLEAPVELRYTSNPNSTDGGFKFALGAKVGTMIKAFTKGKDLQNKAETSLYGSKYIVKEADKKFFNGTKIAATARVGYGIFSLHGAYQITTLLKEGVGPELRPWSIGLTISGL